VRVTVPWVTAGESPMESAIDSQIVANCFSIAGI
jgi:hypothetical protein